jgi:RNA polymerase sigma-70 factor (ECF subfamily)
MTPEANADATLVARLRAGDEALLVELVTAYSPAMRRVSSAILGHDGNAADIVQETWVAALSHLDTFAGRATFKTWLFHILVNRAKTLARRERRWVEEPLEDDGAVPSARFDWIGRWRSGPVPFSAAAGNPEEHVLRDELRRLTAGAISELPPAQRLVVTLRDVEGCSAEEVCSVLEITSGHQRVLLHRGRSRVRAVVEQRLAGEDGAP